jgi:hypothetical protein
MRIWPGDGEEKSLHWPRDLCTASAWAVPLNVWAWAHCPVQRETAAIIHPPTRVIQAERNIGAEVAWYSTAGGFGVKVCHWHLGLVNVEMATDWKLIKQEKDVLVRELSVLHSKTLLLTERIADLGRSLQEICPHEHVDRERDFDYHSSFWWYSCPDCALLSRQPFGSWSTD